LIVSTEEVAPRHNLFQPYQEESGAVHLSLSWELFVLALALLSLVDVVLFFLVRSDSVAQVVMSIDVGITLVFIADFLRRMYVARSKTAYFVRGYGFLDLLGCIPGLRFVRLIRAYAVTRRLTRAGGVPNAVEQLTENRPSSILLVVVLLTVLVIEFGSMAILAVEESAPNGNIKTASDALWYLVVTISTIGYGDRYPTTNLGRIIGTVVLVMGVALFTTMTGFIAHYFYATTTEGPVIKRMVRREARRAARETAQEQAVAGEGRPNPTTD
jgi:voltage-gated potassium channel